MARIAGIPRTVRQIASEFSAKNVTFMAAGIAYNAFISLAPILLILLVVVSAIGGGLEARIVELSQTTLPRPIAELIAEVFHGDTEAPGASVVGLVVLIWGTLKIFRGLDTAFSEIYETTTDNSFLDKLVDGGIVGVAILIAVLATVGVTAGFARFSDTIPYIGVLTPSVLVVGLIVGFLPMFYRFPDADVTWTSVIPGTVFAAVGWAAFQAVFQVYLAFTEGGTGSFFGGVVVVITWLYFSGLVLLLGAVINAVLGGHTSGKAGGVGQGAAGYETEREETMSRQEFAEYLGELRAGVSGGSGVDDRAAAGDGPDPLPRPDGDVTVIEQSSPDEDEREWAVSFRWEAPDEESDREAGAADD
jgi:membrane protein